jgi:hypothetical protein
MPLPQRCPLQQIRYPSRWLNLRLPSLQPLSHR